MEQVAFARSATGSCMNILIEDEWAVAMALEEIVADAGHAVIGPVPTAIKAIDLADQKRPDLALLDIRIIEGLSGITVAKHLKHRCHVPSLFVSASTFEAHENRDVALGLIEKPFRPETVVAAVSLVEALIFGQTNIRSGLQHRRAPNPKEPSCPK